MKREQITWGILILAQSVVLAGLWVLISTPRVGGHGHCHIHEAPVVQPRTIVMENGATLFLEQLQVQAGQSFTVAFSADANLPRDAWVGIIPSWVGHGSETLNDQHDVTYQYVEGRSHGVMTFQAPTNAGQYDVRIHDTDNSGRELGSVSFTVISPSISIPLVR